AGPRRSPWSRTAAGRSACSCRRPLSPPWPAAGCPCGGRRPDRRWPARCWPGCRVPACPSLEVTLSLAVFHRGLAGPVVGPGLAALGDPGRRDLVDHLRDGDRRGRHRAGAGHVAARPVPDPGLEDGLLLAPGHELVVGDQDAVPLED